MKPITETSYIAFIKKLREEYLRSRMSAALRVNEELLRFYYELGKEITQRQYERKYGSGFFRQLSFDLREAIPNSRGFSVSNLRAMVWFYQRYNPLIENTQQAVVQFGIPNTQQAVVQLFSIPWGHHHAILGGCSSLQESLFYVRQTITNGWSRTVLSNFIKGKLYKRQGQAASNYGSSLPAPMSELAKQVIKDPYQFDFLSITGKYGEKQLKDALISNIERFLLELGDGFAYMGREKRIQIGEREKFMDMLFYNVNLHCYVVVEIKVDELESENMGQLGLYVTAVNHQLRKEGDGPNIGILIVGKRTKSSQNTHWR